jgi:hypothetical protein
MQYPFDHYIADLVCGLTQAGIITDKDVRVQTAALSVDQQAMWFWVLSELSNHERIELRWLKQLLVFCAFIIRDKQYQKRDFYLQWEMIVTASEVTSILVSAGGTSQESSSKKTPPNKTLNSLPTKQLLVFIMTQITGVMGNQEKAKQEDAEWTALQNKIVDKLDKLSCVFTQRGASPTVLTEANGAVAVVTQNGKSSQLILSDPQVKELLSKSSDLFKGISSVYRFVGTRIAVGKFRPLVKAVQYALSIQEKNLNTCYLYAKTNVVQELNPNEVIAGMTAMYTELRDITTGHLRISDMFLTLVAPELWESKTNTKELMETVAGVVSILNLAQDAIVAESSNEPLELKQVTSRYLEGQEQIRTAFYNLEDLSFSEKLRLDDLSDSVSKTAVGGLGNVLFELAKSLNTDEIERLKLFNVGLTGVARSQSLTTPTERLLSQLMRELAMSYSKTLDVALAISFKAIDATNFTVNNAIDGAKNASLEGIDAAKNTAINISNRWADVIENTSFQVVSFAVVGLLLYAVFCTKCLKYSRKCLRCGSKKQVLTQNQQIQQMKEEYLKKKK